jgi:hypothetical protein
MNKLIGYEVQRRLSPRQVQRIDYTLRLTFTITYTKGKLNKVANALSQYYESNTWYDTYHTDEYVNADTRHDRDLDGLPNKRLD